MKFCKVKSKTCCFLFNKDIHTIKQTIGISMGIFHSGQVCFFISSNRSTLKLIFSWITKSIYHEAWRFIDHLCVINDGTNSLNILNIYIPRNLNWKWSIAKHKPLFLTLALLSRIIFLYIRPLIKETNFHSSLPKFLAAGQFLYFTFCFIKPD